MTEFSELLWLDENGPFSEPRLEGWQCPPSGLLKLNTYAAFCDGKVALAFVLRNDKGVIIHLASKLDDCETAIEVELLAILLAIEEAEAMGWNNIIWSSDSASSVKEIISIKDSEGWRTTRVSLLQIKARFAQSNW